MKNKHVIICIFFATLVAALYSFIEVEAQAPHAERIYLSGTGIDDMRQWDFTCTSGQNSGKWKKIGVPSCWELQGFGDYTYGRWYKTPGASPSTEEGTYRTTFADPRTGNGERVKIVFDGVMTDAEVLVNGESAGEMHQGAFYRFSYDITDLLKAGSKKNQLEVRVQKESANRLVNAAERKADWWLYGGIFRPVWLEVVPETNIRQLTLDARCDGTLRASVEIEGNADGYSLALSVKNLQSGDAALTVDGQGITTHKIEGSDRQDFESQWKDIKAWDTENPNLYVATIELRNADGKTVQERETRIGFRTIEFFAQDGLYLNGKRLILKGVNRHSFSVDGGRATSARLSLQDALLIKEMNMNAVRSHYSPDEHFLDMCDSLGIVYMDELAGWQNAYDTPVGSRLVKEMIERDVNHPCIVIWSNGNEGGWNESLDSLFAKYDHLQQRHVVHPWADFNDLDTHHYPAYLTGVARFTNGYKVFMPTEFMHAMYDQGGGAGLRNFWDRWLTSPLFAGGFIWCFCDEAPKRTDRNNVLDSDGSNAPDGLVGPRREKEGSYYAVRSQWSPIQLKPLMITSHFDGSFFVTNEFTFTNLSQCSMTYKVKACPSPLAGSAEQSVIAEGSVRLPSIEPGETGKAQFDLPKNFTDGDVLEFEAFDKLGSSLCTWSYPINLAKQYFDNQTSEISQSAIKASIAQSDTIAVLRGGDVEVSFNLNSGMIMQVKSGDKEICFNNGPVAVGMKMRYEPTLSSVREEGSDAIYCARYKGAADSIVWRMTADGLLFMDAILLNRAGGGGGFDDAFMDTKVYNLGLTFSYNEGECSGMKWLGRGPYRVWKNRIAGTQYGIWHKDYNNTVTGASYESLVYPEFKGYHANMYWATIESQTTPMTVYSRTDGIFYHIFTPDEPSEAKKATMPKFPKGDISFLLDIPSICSFKPIEQQGPDSQPGNIRIKKGDEGLHMNLTFDFRKP